MATNTIDELTQNAKLAYERILSHIDNTDLYVKATRKHWKKPSLYKTEICDHWRNKRKCFYGARCWYAHGTQELRTACSTDSISVDSAGYESAATTPLIVEMPNYNLQTLSNPPTSSNSTAAEVVLLPSSNDNPIEKQPSPNNFTAVNNVFNNLPYGSYPIPNNPNVNGMNIGMSCFGSSGINFNTSGINFGFSTPLINSNGFNFSTSGVGGFNFGLNGLNTSYGIPPNGINTFNVSGLNGINFGLSNMKISRVNNIWD